MKRSHNNRSHARFTRPPPTTTTTIIIIITRFMLLVIVHLHARGHVRHAERGLLAVVTVSGDLHTVSHLRVHASRRTGENAKRDRLNASIPLILFSASKQAARRNKEK